MRNKHKTSGKNRISTAHLPGAQKPCPFPHVLKDVTRRVEKGAGLSELQGAFKAAVFNPLMAWLLANGSDIPKQILGEPGSDHDILLDECIGYGPIIPAYQSLGHTNAAAMVLCPGAKDNQFFELAAARGVTAIVTCDAARSRPIDLCYIANAAYNQKQGEGDLPGVIVVPQNHYGIALTLRAHKGKILDYLAAPKRAVLDL